MSTELREERERRVGASRGQSTAEQLVGSQPLLVHVRDRDRDRDRARDRARDRVGVANLLVWGIGLGIGLGLLTCSSGG